jgi:putative colanic acid biosynthesis glycosyltransferase
MQEDLYRYGRCFFSIVTITYNNLEGIKRTKESLLRQNCKDWQWVVIDGASTDGSHDIVGSWRSDTITVLSERDNGIYDAMNKGLRLAAGDYVLVMNSGDEFAGADVLDSLKEILTTDPVDVLYGASIMRFGKDRIVRQVRHPSHIWHGQPGLHQATVFCRDTHQRYLYDTNFKICGDYDVITRMWRDRLSFQSCSVLISVNEFSSNSTSGRSKLRLIREAVRCQRRNLGLSWPVIVASVILRAINSAGAKIFSYLSARRAR